MQTSKNVEPMKNQGSRVPAKLHVTRRAKESAKQQLRRDEAIEHALSKALSCLYRQANTATIAVSLSQTTLDLLAKQVEISTHARENEILDTFALWFDQYGIINPRKFKMESERVSMLKQVIVACLDNGAIESIQRMRDASFMLSPQEMKNQERLHRLTKPERQQSKKTKRIAKFAA